MPHKYRARVIAAQNPHEALVQDHTCSSSTISLDSAHPTATYHSTGTQTLPPPNSDVFKLVHGREPEHGDMTYRMGLAALGRYLPPPARDPHDLYYGAPFKAPTPATQIATSDSGFQTLNAGARKMSLFRSKAKAAVTTNKYRDIAAAEGLRIWAETNEDKVLHSQQHSFSIKLDQDGNAAGQSLSGKFLPNIWGEEVQPTTVCDVEIFESSVYSVQSVPRSYSHRPLSNRVADTATSQSPDPRERGGSSTVPAGPTKDTQTATSTPGQHSSDDGAIDGNQTRSIKNTSLTASPEKSGITKSPYTHVPVCGNVNEIIQNFSIEASKASSPAQQIDAVSTRAKLTPSSRIQPPVEKSKAKPQELQSKPHQDNTSPLPVSNAIVDSARSPISNGYDETYGSSTPHDDSRANSLSDVQDEDPGSAIQRSEKSRLIRRTESAEGQKGCRRDETYREGLREAPPNKDAVRQTQSLPEITPMRLHDKVHAQPTTSQTNGLPGDISAPLRKRKRVDEIQRFVPRARREGDAREQAKTQVRKADLKHTEKVKQAQQQLGGITNQDTQPHKRVPKRAREEPSLDKGKADLPKTTSIKPLQPLPRQVPQGLKKASPIVPKATTSIAPEDSERVTKRVRCNSDVTDVKQEATKSNPTNPSRPITNPRAFRKQNASCDAPNPRTPTSSIQQRTHKRSRDEAESRPEEEKETQRAPPAAPSREIAIPRPRRTVLPEMKLYVPRGRRTEQRQIGDTCSTIASNTNKHNTGQMTTHEGRQKKRRK